MTRQRTFAYLASAVLLGLSVGAQGKDIDLFAADPSTINAPPNVLFMIDNSANWNATIGGTTKMEMEHEALYDVLSSPDLLGTADKPRVRVGLMHFAKGNSPRGGKVISAVQDLTATYQDELKCILYSNSDCTTQRVAGDENLEKTNNAPYAMMFNEAYRYFAGAMPYSGTQDGDEDPDAISGGYYVSPQEADACSRDFTILIGNGEPDSGEDSDAESQLRQLGGVLDNDPISLGTWDSFESNWSDEFARFLNGADVYQKNGDDVDQNVTTYVIYVNDPTSNQSNTRKGKSAVQWMKSIANQGGGKYFEVSTVQDIMDALNEITDEIQAVNTVFASTTLPVSVNVRGTNLNQVYMGVFRPDDASRPRWQGNLKLYQIGMDPDTGAIFLADADGNKAENRTTGFIDDNARSFWTHNSSYWAFAPSGDPLSESDNPDGAVVEKGGVHQRLRDSHALSGDSSWRHLYTCTGTCTDGNNLSNYPFDTGNGSISASDLGAADSTERDALIRWVRGEDVDDKDNDGQTTDARPSIHGDVLHSQPAVVNYGNGTVVAYYGANDGIFHAVEGGTDENVSTGDGKELWGFIPREFFGQLKTLRTDAPAADFGNHPDFVDGKITMLHIDANGDDIVDPATDKLYIYLTMRRGGRFVYALDVTDYTNPKLLWHKSSNDSGYGEMGQSWSALTPIRLKDGSGGTRYALTFGAGYDPGADDVAPDPTATGPTYTQGRGIFVVDAADGHLIWHAGPPNTHSSANGAVIDKIGDMTYSIPSSVTAIDRDLDGHQDRLYVGDTGGQLWRVDINDPLPSAWRVHKIAYIGGGDPTRQFFHQPDVVYTDYGYDAILLGSGDREHPFNEATSNSFYMFKDAYQLAAIEDDTHFVNRGGTITTADLYDASDNTIQDGTASASDSAMQSLSAARGWKVDLNGGEKVISSAVTLGGTVFFNTHEPAPSSGENCVPSLGIARTYMLNFQDATATVNNDGLKGLTKADRILKTPGGGFLPSPTPFVVEIDGKKIPGASVGPMVLNAPGPEWDRRYRTFWYRERD